MILFTSIFIYSITYHLSEIHNHLTPPRELLVSKKVHEFSWIFNRKILFQWLCFFNGCISQDESPKKRSCNKQPPRIHSKKFPGVRHNLKQINIFSEEGNINELGGEFAGQHRFKARSTVEEALKQHLWHNGYRYLHGKSCWVKMVCKKLTFGYPWRLLNFFPHRRHGFCWENA